MERDDNRVSVEAAVFRRYAAAAREVEPALCCPVEYDPGLLEVIPAEVIERDYGCGDPSRHVREGEVVLDLGSGSGKACFIAAQVVGAEGCVFGVDANDEMLSLARGAQAGVAQRIGYDNVRFMKGRIQDLSLDLDRLESRLAEHPVGSIREWQELEGEIERWRNEQPLVSDGSIDIAVSNCVLNLVQSCDRDRLFRELLRVLKPGGRAVISDIVCDRDVPEHLKEDPTLWSGCISGAFREDEFLEAFSNAGFGKVDLLDRQQTPWTVVEGIEFRSVTVCAWSMGGTSDRGQAEIFPVIQGGSNCCDPEKGCC
ncbi:MAG: methyltransferase [Planctomycetaceae bacterium]|nr:methyltransferase [Planctomycetaceae bacterium]